MRPVFTHILRITCLALTIFFPGPAASHAQEASSSSHRVTVGLSLGSAAVHSRPPVEERIHFHLGLNGFVPLSRSIGLLGELAHGGWKPLKITVWPAEWTRPPYDFEGFDSVVGRYLELHLGPIVQLGSLLGLHLSSGAMIGVRYYKEKWERYDFYRFYTFEYSYDPGPTFPSGPTEIHATAQARLRLAGNPAATGMMLEACYLWSRRVRGDVDSPAYSRPDGLRLLLRMPLYPWPYKIERTRHQLPNTPKTIYMKGVSGTFVGLVGGIVAIESGLIVRGRKPGKSSDYTVAVVASGVIGSALGISRARRDVQLKSVGARLAGGALAAIIEGVLFYKLFDFYLPNPGLMLAVPFGSMLGERYLNQD